MKVILQKDIPTLGDAGDVKEVAAGYARNYLLPKKLVIVADDSNKRVMEHQKRLIKIKKEKKKKEGQKIAETLSGTTLTFTAQAGEEDKLFGSITTMDISAKLNELGLKIDKRKVALESPIKKTGEYEVSVKLAEGLTAKVKVVVEKEQ
jgi:large subunit ribosomal protein L9